MGLVNPPVLLYWVIVFSFLKEYFYSLNSSITAIIFLLIGIFIGKIATLYAYGKLGNRFQKKSSNKQKIDKIIGVSLVVLATVQVVKVFVIG
jgi:threonine/homoserine/homoserine lactone efflux protein